MDPVQRVKDLFNESIQLKLDISARIAPLVASAAQSITACLLRENKVLVCGNGNCAGDAQRFTSQMLNRFEMERPGLPAVSLVADAAVLTSIADDLQYAEIFSRQIMALGNPGDILMVISTSGDSHNIIHAIDAAHDRGMAVIALTGREGGQSADLLHEADIEIRVPNWSTARIQEVHVMIIHAINELVDQYLLGSGE